MPHSTLYLSTEGLPVPIPATDARTVVYSYGWFSVRAARTTIGASTVYVELEDRGDGCASIVRDRVALQRARFVEALAHSDNVTIRDGEVVR